MKKKRLFQTIFVILLLVIAYVRIIQEKKSEQENIGIKETRVALGTFVTIDIRNNISNKQSILDSAFSLIEKYEKQLSFSEPNSEISKINKCREEKIQVSLELAYLLQKSMQISEFTNGAFDITIGAITEKYDFVEKKIPSTEQISQKIGLVNYKKLKIENNVLIKENSNIHIDLGGIAKGFIIDKVVEYLRNQGIENAGVDAGGDMFVMKNERSCGWKIGIQHPRHKGEIFGEVCLKNMAIVTSGDYARYSIQKGKRIHHIFDPETGLSADKSISATVIAPDATTADALCTAIFVMGPQTGTSLINNIENVEALIIYEKNGKLQYKLSDGFEKYQFHCNE